MQYSIVSMDTTGPRVYRISRLDLAMMKRQKRRPDRIELNFVESHPKRKCVKIRRVSYSLARPTQEASSSPSTTSATFASMCSSASSSLCETPSNFGGDNELFDFQGETSSCFNTKPRESHTERKQKAAEAWAKVRRKLHHTHDICLRVPKG